ncbi:hypothetical protein K438DRAFT_2077668 [Mycena galopus ATCC 62051]|nr:hypothetical protein K438DRAFT_2077668 [Mycena galopus ATCC 62051]
MVKSELDNWASGENNETSEGDQDIDGNSEDSRDVAESTEITQGNNRKQSRLDKRGTKMKATVGAARYRYNSSSDSEELYPSGRRPGSRSVKSHSHRVDYESTASSEAEEERMMIVLDKKIHWAYNHPLCVICIGPERIGSPDTPCVKKDSKTHTCSENQGSKDEWVEIIMVYTISSAVQDLKSEAHSLSQYGKKASKVVESNLLWADSFREHVHLTSFQPSKVVLSLVLDISGTHLEAYENNNGLENMAKPKSKQINAKDSNG